jgi:7,8-dihydropterin-6-yl-methyl-4-(beta-D-ribofuranosyl)aminobenzene 5'-phosphate synthase
MLPAWPEGVALSIVNYHKLHGGGAGIRIAALPHQLHHSRPGSMHDLSNRLQPVDSLTIDVITDDVSDAYVTKTLFAVSEFANIVKAGARVIAGETLLLASLGLGLRFTLEYAGRRRQMLFDTGPEGSIFLRNCRNLGVDLGEIELITMTHGHWDHMGALADTVKEIKARGGDVAVHVNPDMFFERAVELPNGRIIPVAIVPSPGELESLGATVVNDGNPQLLFDDHVYYSGEIPRVTPFEKGRLDHLRRLSPSSPWVPDPLLMDERMVVIDIKGLGVMVFSACSHAGIVNVCLDTRRLFPSRPFYGAMGGLHLGGVMEKIIPDTVEGLGQFGLKQLIVGHCTGWRALHALATAYPEIVSQSAIGTTYTLSADAVKVSSR